jgi:hypothetical protein
MRLFHFKVKKKKIDHSGLVVWDGPQAHTFGLIVTRTRWSLVRLDAKAKRPGWIDQLWLVVEH